MSLFRTEEFVAASGKILPWKVECDALKRGDWEWAAEEIARRVRYSAVEGVPRGGLKLARELENYVDWQSNSPFPLLIVDDVLTTGGSMERQRAGRDAIGFVVFARGPCPPWVRALWTFTGQDDTGKW